MGDTAEHNLEWAVKNGDLDQINVIVGKDKSMAQRALPNGRYPLCVAADYGHKDVLEFLISHGAQVNVTDKYGISPLLSAIYEGHADCVKYLLSKGASKSGKSPSGEAYIDCAESDDIKNLLK